LLAWNFPELLVCVLELVVRVLVVRVLVVRELLDGLPPHAASAAVAASAASSVRAPRRLLIGRTAGAVSPSSCSLKPR
jgi:hypothetical protein